MKKIVVLVIVVVLGGLAFWRIRQTGDVSDTAGARRGGPGVVAVESAPIVRGAIDDRRRFTGTLKPRSRYIVAPKIAGRLESLLLQIGDRVEPGQALATLDDAEFVQQVEQARAARDVAQASVEQQTTALALAERERERVAVLRERGIASEAEWDAVEADFQTANALLRVARAQLQERESALLAAEIRLSYTRIQAPDRSLEDGYWVVEARFVDEGAMLAANTPMLAVVDIGRLTAVIQVIERDYAAMRNGLPVDLDTDAFPEKVFPGTVVRIAPTLSEASRQARVEIDVPNKPPVLRPGLFVRAGIVFARREDTRLALRTALVSRQGREGVFRVDRDAGVARFVPVETGIRDARWVEILDPGLEGEVVTLGHHLLADGTAITVCDRDNAPGSAHPDAPAPASGTGGPRS